MVLPPQNRHPTITFGNSEFCNFPYPFKLINTNLIQKLSHFLLDFILVACDTIQHLDRKIRKGSLPWGLQLHLPDSMRIMAGGMKTKELPCRMGNLKLIIPTFTTYNYLIQWLSLGNEQSTLLVLNLLNINIYLNPKVTCR